MPFEKCGRTQHFQISRQPIPWQRKTHFHRSYRAKVILHISPFSATREIFNVAVVVQRSLDFLYRVQTLTISQRLGIFWLLYVYKTEATCYFNFRCKMQFPGVTNFKITCILLPGARILTSTLQPFNIHSHPLKTWRGSVLYSSLFHHNR